MKRIVSQRMIGASGLLLAFSLVATGCSSMSEASEQAPDANQAVVAAEESRDTLSRFSIRDITITTEFEEAAGDKKADGQRVAASGLRILKIMIEDYPEYTVGGFSPTEEDWLAVSSTLRSVTSETAMANLTQQWQLDKKLPAMTSVRKAEDGSVINAHTSESGETCTDSDSPYKYEMASSHLTSRPDATGALVVVLESSLTTTIPCLEGFNIQGQTNVSIPLEDVAGRWMLREGYEISLDGPFTKVG